MVTETCSLQLAFPTMPIASCSLLISGVQEVSHDTAKFLRLLSLWPMSTFLHDVELRVRDERLGSLRIGKRDGWILLTMNQKRRGRDFVQSGNKIAPQTRPADLTPLYGDKRLSSPWLACRLIDLVNEFIGKMGRMVNETRQQTPPDQGPAS